MLLRFDQSHFCPARTPLHNVHTVNSSPETLEAKTPLTVQYTFPDGGSRRGFARYRRLFCLYELSK